MKRIRLIPVLIVAAGVGWGVPRIYQAIQLSILGQETIGVTVRNIPNAGGDPGSCPIVQFADAAGITRSISYGSCAYPELPIGTKVRVLYRGGDPSVAIVNSPDVFVWPVFAIAFSVLFASLLGWTKPKESE